MSLLSVSLESWDTSTCFGVVATVNNSVVREVPCFDVTVCTCPYYSSTIIWVPQYHGIQPARKKVLRDRSRHLQHCLLLKLVYTTSIIVVDNSSHSMLTKIAVCRQPQLDAYGVSSGFKRIQPPMLVVTRDVDERLVPSIPLTFSFSFSFFSKVFLHVERVLRSSLRSWRQYRCL